MRFLNMLGIVARYLLAAVSCISIAQFLLLLNVGTENAGRLAAQSLARGVICGIVAAVWFYRARKVRPQTPANVQTQVQVASLPSSQAQPTVPSFWEEHRGFVAFIAGIVTVVVVGVLAQVGMFQSWIPSTGTSQPRFIHVQGAPPWKMFDNKTGQACDSGPVAHDSVDRIKEDMGDRMMKEYSEELQKCDTASPYYSKCITSLNLVSQEKGKEIITETLAGSKSEPCPLFGNPSDDPDKPRCIYPQYKEFYDRYDAVIANPDKPPVYHDNGMPYCSELTKKWW
jgi:hypothetical protein